MANARDPTETSQPLLYFASNDTDVAHSERDRYPTDQQRAGSARNGFTCSIGQQWIALKEEREGVDVAGADNPQRFEAMRGEQCRECSLRKKIVMKIVEDGKPLAHDQTEERFHVVHDRDRDPSWLKVAPHPLEMPFGMRQMIEHVDEGDGIERRGREFRILVEARRD